MANTDKVMLREKSGHGQAREFSAKHAEKLLNYPGSQWEEVPAEKAGKSADAEKDAKPKAGSGTPS